MFSFFKAVYMFFGDRAFTGKIGSFRKAYKGIVDRFAWIFGKMLRTIGYRPYAHADHVVSTPLFLDFEVTREKKYRLLFHNGSLKEQVPKKSIQVWYSRTQLFITSAVSWKAARKQSQLQDLGLRVQELGALGFLRLSSSTNGPGPKKFKLFKIKLIYKA